MSKQYKPACDRTDCKFFTMSEEWSKIKCSECLENSQRRVPDGFDHFEQGDEKGPECRSCDDMGFALGEWQDGSTDIHACECGKYTDDEARTACFNQAKFIHDTVALKCTYVYKTGNPA